MEELNNQQPSQGSETSSTPGQPTDVSITPEVLKAIRANPEYLSQLIADLDDDTFTKIPVAEQRMSRFVNKKQQELDKQYKERQENERREQEQIRTQRLQAQQIVTSVDAMEPAQFQAAMRTNPQLVMQYAQAKQILMSTPNAADENKVIERLWNNMRRQFESTYEVDLSGAKSMEDVVNMAVESQSGKKLSELEKSFEQKLAALRTEMMGQVQRSSSQPEKGTASGTSSGKRTFTRDEISKLSHAEFIKLEAEIDEAAREGRIK